MRLSFDGMQAKIIASAFTDAAKNSSYQIRACAILPEHVHLVVGRHPTRNIEMIVGHLKGWASMYLNKHGAHPFQHEREKSGGRPSPWGESFWDVYLDCHADIRRAVTYVERNPAKEGKRPQRWRFVEAGDT